MSNKLGLSQKSRVDAAMAAIEAACQTELDDSQEILATGIKCGLVAGQAGSTVVARNYLGLVYHRDRNLTASEYEELVSIGELIGLWVLGRRELKRGGLV